MKTYNRTSAFYLVLGTIFSLITIGLVTKSEAQANQPFAALIFLSAGLLAFGWSMLIKRQPPVLVLTAEGVSIQEKMFGSSQFLAWRDLGQISYVIEERYGYGYRFPRREVRFFNRQHVQVAFVRLDRIAGADFNEIYDYVYPLAPHILWKFPN
ncbi:TPA: hypothetical protein U1C23_001373 [Streptococcus suis]|uniref:hypothetical protein n=1 Tax=Streptococcus suis TaxID=1307 RepID=UPI001ABE7569|nr:hypothetical protein [Streptococcus suis]MBO4109762.1 hypothetical protein [Streptococcus suis]HEM3614518.1 hypothetical protein [Streptococcus suis]HEM3635304.1 hypothetical protein [Streptococcus suis]HEM3641909.1 hypothetical protein [Streptococcus suis]HEM3704754.1 hypothetical protein [Streptococcus suis]